MVGVERLPGVRRLVVALKRPVARHAAEDVRPSRTRAAEDRVARHDDVRARRKRLVECIFDPRAAVLIGGLHGIRVVREEPGRARAVEEILQFIAVGKGLQVGGHRPELVAALPDKRRQVQKPRVDLAVDVVSHISEQLDLGNLECAPIVRRRLFFRPDARRLPVRRRNEETAFAIGLAVDEAEPPVSPVGRAISSFDFRPARIRRPLIERHPRGACFVKGLELPCAGHAIEGVRTDGQDRIAVDHDVLARLEPCVNRVLQRDAARRVGNLDRAILATEEIIREKAVRLRGGLAVKGLLERILLRTRRDVGRDRAQVAGFAHRRRHVDARESQIGSLRPEQDGRRRQQCNRAERLDSFLLHV